MKIKKLIAMALLTISLTTLTVGCGNKTLTPQEKASLVVAELGETSITIGYIDELLNSSIQPYIDQYGEDYESELDENTLLNLNMSRVSLLNSLIQEHILLIKAEELGLIEDEDAIIKKAQERVDELVKMYGDDGYAELKKAENLSDEDVLTQFVNQIKQERVVDHVGKDIKATDEEMKSFYDSNTDYFTKGIGANSRHILFATEEEAQTCYDKISSGESTFEKEFKAITEKADSESTTIAEDLGFVQHEEPGFDKDFLAGFKELKDNEISKPVKSSFGYHIIEAKDVSTKEEVIPFDEVKEFINIQVSYEKQFEAYSKKLEEWKKELNIKSYETRFEK